MSAESNQGEQPLEALVERFWDLGEEVAEIEFNVRPSPIPETILKRLGGPPLGDASATVVSELAQLYRQVSKQAMRTAYEDD